MTVLTAPARRLKRRRRVRAKVRGSAERPRISVFRSNRGIAAQLIDDDSGRTVLLLQRAEDVTDYVQERESRRDVAEQGEGGLVARQKPIEVGELLGNEYVVRSGLKAGDRVTYRGRALEIENVADLNGRRAYLSMQCSERVVTG